MLFRGKENFFSFHVLLDCLNFIKITVCSTFIIKKKITGISVCRSLRRKNQDPNVGILRGWECHLAVYDWPEGKLGKEKSPGVKQGHLKKRKKKQLL